MRIFQSMPYLMLKLIVAFKLLNVLFRPSIVIFDVVIKLRVYKSKISFASIRMRLWYSFRSKPGLSWISRILQKSSILRLSRNCFELVVYAYVSPVSCAMQISKHLQTNIRLYTRYTRCTTIRM